MDNSFQEPEFWDSHYRAGNTPWELSRTPARLSHWIAGHQAPGAVLIPGCGCGPEISAFAHAGWNVTAIDFSPASIARAAANLATGMATLISADFFTHPFGPKAFDLIYERTFLTALGPVRWPATAARYRDLLKPNGRVIGYFCYGYEPEPPPFFQPPDEPPVLAGSFALEEDAISEDALPIFGEHERWQIWRKS